MSEINNNSTSPVSTIKAGDTDIPYISMYSERGYMGDNILRDFVKVTIPSEPLLTATQLTDLLQNPWTVTDDNGERWLSEYDNNGNPPGIGWWRKA